MTLKWLFFPKNCENCPAAGGLCPQTPIRNTFELHQFVQHAAQLQHFLDRIMLTFDLSLLANRGCSCEDVIDPVEIGYVTRPLLKKFLRAP